MNKYENENVGVGLIYLTILRTRFLERSVYRLPGIYPSNTNKRRGQECRYTQAQNIPVRVNF